MFCYIITLHSQQANVACCMLRCLHTEKVDFCILYLLTLFLKRLTISYIR